MSNNKKGVHAGEDGPPFVYGQPNLDFKGSKPAAQNSTKNSNPKRDFASSHTEEKVPFIDADLEAKISEVEFPENYDDDIVEYDDSVNKSEYVLSSPERNVAIFIHDYQEDPVSIVERQLFNFGSEDQDDFVDEHFDGDYDRYNEEFIFPLSDVYIDASARYYNSGQAGDVELDVETYEYDYATFTFSHEEPLDSEKTLHESWDELNDVRNGMEYIIPSEIQDRIECAKDLLLEGTFDQLYTERKNYFTGEMEKDYIHATNPQTVTSIPDMLGDYMKNNGY